MTVLAEIVKYYHQSMQWWKKIDDIKTWILRRAWMTPIVNNKLLDTHYAFGYWLKYQGYFYNEKND